MQFDFEWLVGGGVGLLIGLAFGLGYEDPLFGVAIAVCWAVALGGGYSILEFIDGYSARQWLPVFAVGLLVGMLPYASQILADVPAVPVSMLLIGLWGGGVWTGITLEDRSEPVER